MGKKSEWRSDLRGSEYRPYETVRIPTRGKASRVPGLKTGRLHHVLSSIELRCFYLLEWLPHVVDIREQFALPLPETEAIAEELGVKHPTIPETGAHKRMSSDFVVTVTGPDGERDIVRSVKPSEELGSKRTLEKLEVERRYWIRRGVEWKLVTERDLPADLVRNIEWVHPYTAASSLSVPTEQVDWLTQRLEEQLRREPTRAVAVVCSEIDERAGFEPGTHFALVRHALANRRWPVDMNTEIVGSRPLPFLDPPPDDHASA